MSLAKKRRLRSLYAEEARHLADLESVPTEEQFSDTLRTHYGWTDEAKIAECAKVMRDFHVRWNTPRPRHGLHAPAVANHSKKAKP